MLPIQDVEESLYGNVGLHVPLGTRPQVRSLGEKRTYGDREGSAAANMPTPYVAASNGRVVSGLDLLIVRTLFYRYNSSYLYVKWVSDSNRLLLSL